MWNQRMFLFAGEARYHDVLERTAYNGFISGVSLSGDRFFYPNPLAYDGVAKNNHDHAGRAPWFGCACCPPDLMRTLAALTGWFYAVRDDSLYVNFYAPNEGEANVAGVEVRLTQATDYPWSGAIRLTVTLEKSSASTVRLRIPGRAQGQPVPSDLYTCADAARPAWSLHVAGKPVTAVLENGYAVLTRTWQPGDVVELALPMPVHKVHGHPRIEAVRRCLAFERGPVIYAFEDTAGQTNPEEITVSCATRAGVHAQPGLLGDVVTLVLEDFAAPKPGSLIPYCTWNNRGHAPMAVWLPETAG
jgi:DUF1680 family protein